MAKIGVSYSMVALGYSYASMRVMLKTLNIFGLVFVSVLALHAAIAGDHIFWLFLFSAGCFAVSLAARSMSK